MIDEAFIDCDEDGFHLAVIGDFAEVAERYLADPNASTLRLRLSQDAAIQLLASAEGELGPWVMEMEYHRAACQSAERASVLWLVADDEDSGYEPGDPKHPGWSSRMADAADTERKRAKGE